MKKLSGGVMIKFNKDPNQSDYSDHLVNQEESEEEEVIIKPKKNIFETKVKLLGNQIGSDKGKKTLVLDLDETLIHSVFGKEINPKFSFSLLFNKEYYLISTIERPHLQNFLK